jgi:hypothetical protein
MANSGIGHKSTEILLLLALEALDRRRLLLLL